MRRLSLKLVAISAIALSTTSVPAAAPSAVEQGVGPSFASIGPLAFGPDGTLFAGDTSSAAILSLDLGTAATGGATGSKDVAGVDAKIAAVLGTDAAGVTITDLAVHPKTQHSYVSVMRGTGADAKPALVRIDGAGTITLVSLDAVKFSKIALPNAPTAAAPGARNNPRSQSIMDIAITGNRVIVAGLSNEEFASKLWSVGYPFTNADRGTSVEIFHGNHGAVETRSPIFSFIPYNVAGQQNIIAGYLCTPLVKFPVSELAAGTKVRGTTIAELGAGNRPIDMILYNKDGKDFLLMSNTARGVMKIPTATFATETPITERVGGTAGVKYETITAMTGIEQMDLFDKTRSIVIMKNADGTKSLTLVVLP